MAQTKRKRRTKHRGNAAGIVETRGRTGRRATASERKPATGSGSRTATTRANRYEKPPTWRNAATKGALISLIGAIIITIISKSMAQGAVILVFMLVFYIPFSYYTDLWLHRRWLRKGGGQARR